MKFKKLFIALAIFILSFLVFLYQDNSLSDESLELLTPQEVATNQDGYFYLMGIHAAENEDPISIGKSLLASFQEQEKSPQENLLQSFDYQHYPEEKKLALPDGDLFCRLKEEGCIGRIFEQIPSFNPTDYSTLVNRYLTYMQMPEHNLLTTPYINEPLPPYLYITKGADIFLLTKLQESQSNPADALNQLNNHLNLLRQKLANANNLIEKMVYTHIISQCINFMFVISAQNLYEIPVTIDSPTPEEIDLTAPFKREFLGHALLYKHLNGNPYLLDEENKIPGFIAKLLFKENMTTNIAATYFSRLIERSKLSAFEFAQYAKAPAEAKSHYSLRNSTGSILASIPYPDNDRYIFKLHELNNKINLFNTIIASKSTSIQLMNPYYQLMETPYINKNHICLKAPMEDDAKSGCLIVYP
jgi:hypothetical protein